MQLIWEEYFYDQVINFVCNGTESRTEVSVIRISVGSRIGTAISVNATELTERGGREANKERLRWPLAARVLMMRRIS